MQDEDEGEEIKEEHQDDTIDPKNKFQKYYTFTQTILYMIKQYIAGIAKKSKSKPALIEKEEAKKLKDIPLDEEGALFEKFLKNQENITRILPNLNEENAKVILPLMAHYINKIKAPAPSEQAKEDDEENKEQPDEEENEDAEDPQEDKLPHKKRAKAKAQKVDSEEQNEEEPEPQEEQENQEEEQEEEEEKEEEPKPAKKNAAQKKNQKKRAEKNDEDDDEGQ